MSEFGKGASNHAVLRLNLWLAKGWLLMLT